jgi:ABC-type antimicrobial peptide transport system permease subunit
VGTFASAFAVRWLRSLFFHVAIGNPTLFGAVALLMILVAVGAALAPAIRAAKIDPIVALRHE